MAQCHSFGLAGPCRPSLRPTLAFTFEALVVISPARFQPLCGARVARFQLFALDLTIAMYLRVWRGRLSPEEASRDTNRHHDGSNQCMVHSLCHPPTISAQNPAWKPRNRLPSLLGKVISNPATSWEWVRSMYYALLTWERVGVWEEG